MTSKYCVECGREHISHKKWERNIRFCSMECKYNFFHNHFKNSKWNESKRYIKGGLIRHLLSKEASPGCDVLDGWGINVVPKQSVKESAKTV